MSYKVNKFILSLEFILQRDLTRRMDFLINDSLQKMVTLQLYNNENEKKKYNIRIAFDLFYYLSKFDRNVLKIKTMQFSYILYINTLMKDKEGLVLCKTICLQWYCTYEKGNMCNVRVFSVTKANQKG